jgi:hypothetical protein
MHYTRPPEEIERLEEEVQRRLYGRIRDLHLSLDQDGLVLRGHARSYYNKQLAQHEVTQVSKVPIQANEIEVLRT